MVKSRPMRTYRVAVISTLIDVDIESADVR